MTQTKKDLLLKDLCARLPYGVKITVNDRVEILEGISVLDTTVEYDSFLSSDIEEVKTYLFPMSSMTEEQKEEFEKMSDLDCEYVTTQIKNDSPNWTSGLNRVNWLIKNHFDIYDLIPMGLAEDATGKNIY